MTGARSLRSPHECVIWTGGQAERLTGGSSSSEVANGKAGQDPLRVPSLSIILAGPLGETLRLGRCLGHCCGRTWWFGQTHWGGVNSHNLDETIIAVKGK